LIRWPVVDTHDQVPFVASVMHMNVNYILQVLLRNLCFLIKVTLRISFPLLEFADTLIRPQPSPGISNTGICPRGKQTSSKHSFDSFLDLVHDVCWMETGYL